MNPRFASRDVRPAVQAGRFYEADPARLRAGIEASLAQAASPAPAAPPLALLAPHAGYVYSGRVAAAAYRAIRGCPIDRVLILAPSHYVGFSGAALPRQAFFATPLGQVAVDRAACQALETCPLIRIDDEAHAQEHAIEVQVPFLQVALGEGFQIVPVTLGRVGIADLATLGDAFFALIEQRRAAGERWLVVASSDTYHGYDAGECEANDARLLELIRGMDPDILEQAERAGEVMACGWSALALTMGLARRAGASSGQPLLRSDSRLESGSGSGYVVGYVAARFD
jgi:AmmeMemoRadiSam system protein B